MVAAGGTVASVGVHGCMVDLYLETLWSRSLTITTQLVGTSTTPMVLKTAQAGTIDPLQLVAHRFALDDILDAYDMFGRASETQALKVIIAA